MTFSDSAVTDVVVDTSGETAITETPLPIVSCASSGGWQPVLLRSTVVSGIIRHSSNAVTGKAAKSSEAQKKRDREAVRRAAINGAVPAGLHENDW